MIDNLATNGKYSNDIKKRPIVMQANGAESEPPATGNIAKDENAVIWKQVEDEMKKAAAAADIAGARDAQQAALGVATDSPSNGAEYTPAYGSYGTAEAAKAIQDYKDLIAPTSKAE